jgi:RNA polymerase sigma-70 factor (ECF subfamily)
VEQDDPMTAAELTDLDSLPETELVERCRARDEAAVHVLTRRYSRRLYRIARGILRNDAEAEDVVQETYVRAFTGLDRFRGEAGFGTWLVRIAMNEALGRLRRRRPAVDVESVPTPAKTPDPEMTMAQTELRGLLEKSIDDLPDAFRTVFIARMVEGMSVEETAALFGLRPETVKTRVHRARLRLQASLDQHLGPMVPEAFAFEGARCARITARVLARLAAQQSDPAAARDGG